MDGVNKQLEKIGDTPVFVMSALKFDCCEKVGEIIIAAPQNDAARYEKLARNFGVTKLAAVTEGGATRFLSVKNALERVSPKADFIAIHDGARPLILTEDIERVLLDAEKYNAAIAAVPASDTVKLVGANGFIESTPPRSKVYYAQTPQVFRLDVALAAHERAERDGFVGTDDASLVERDGGRVACVDSSRDNIKVTLPEDLAIAEAALAPGHVSSGEAAGGGEAV